MKNLRAGVLSNPSNMNSVETKISLVRLPTGTGTHCMESYLGHGAEKAITAILKYWYKDKSVF